ncbi:MAG: hypothetical protein MJ108_09315 [Saccharofermentans sp.]|nr:hypothetical protein [Saccharofermentans sp.]
MNIKESFEQACIKCLVEAGYSSPLVIEHLKDEISFICSATLDDNEIRYYCIHTNKYIRSWKLKKIVRESVKDNVTYGIISNGLFDFFATRYAEKQTFPYYLNVMDESEDESSLIEENEFDLVEYESIRDIILDDVVDSDEEYREEEFYDEDDEFDVLKLPPSNIRSADFEDVSDVVDNPEDLNEDYLHPSFEIIDDEPFKQAMIEAHDALENKMGAIKKSNFPLGTINNSVVSFDFNSHDSLFVFENINSKNVFDTIMLDCMFLKPRGTYEIYIIGNQYLEKRWCDIIPDIKKSDVTVSPLERLSKLSQELKFRKNKEVFILIPNVNIFDNHMNELISFIHYLKGDCIKFVLGITNIETGNEYKRLYESIDVKLMGMFQDERLGRYIDGFYRDVAFKSGADMLLINRGNVNSTSVKLFSVNDLIYNSVKNWAKDNASCDIPRSFMM